MEIQKELHRVVSTAIIQKDGKYLIVKRNPNRKVLPGRWSLPGGGLETDDYLGTPRTTPDAWYFAIENSLKREVKEETGLEVDNLKYLLSLTFIRSDNIPVAVLSYYGDWKGGEVNPVRNRKGFRGHNKVSIFSSQKPCLTLNANKHHRIQRSNHNNHGKYLISNGVKLNDENTNYCWVTLEEARNYDLVEGILAEIEMADRIINGENQEKVEFEYKSKPR